jgi:hypothetical protein
MADAIVATRTSAARRALARAGAGKSLSLDELTTLCDARGEDLVDLSAISDGATSCRTRGRSSCR